ncbi:MAG: beta-barrel assembly-enhancing protease [Phycisphaerales bacterium]|nr:beta-barrel assembly-enhancing protease [Phycisphaerales bacterium]
MRKMSSTVAVSIFLLLGGLFAGGCASDAKVVQAAAGVHTQLEPAVIEDPELANYLQSVGDRIIQTAQELDRQGYGPKTHKSEKTDWMFKNMKFHFVNSKTLNAFTTGGEHMYIYNELFQQSRSEDELAAVMAHEYGHVYARHVGKGMNRQYGLLAAAAALGGAGYVAGGKEKGTQYATLGASLGAAGGQFLNMGFTRKDENEADKLGFDFYTHAGWDPNKFDDFFQAMIDKGLDTTPELVSDHPSLKNRVAATQERVKKLPPAAAQWRKPPVATPEQFKALQARAAKLGETLPNDKSLENTQQLLAALPRSCIFPYVPEDEAKAREELVKRAQAAEAAQKKQQQSQQPPPPSAKRKRTAAAATPAGSQVISSPAR